MDNLVLQQLSLSAEYLRRQKEEHEIKIRLQREKVSRKIEGLSEEERIEYRKAKVEASKKYATKKKAEKGLL